MRKRIDHWCSVVPEKFPTLRSIVQWETLRAYFPARTVGPWVGNFLSPLDINDGFYLSHIPVSARGKDQKWTVARRRHVYLCHHCNVKMTHHVESQRIHDFVEAFFHVF